MSRTGVGNVTGMTNVVNARTPCTELDAPPRRSSDEARGRPGTHFAGTHLYGSPAAGDFPPEDAGEISDIIRYTSEVGGAVEAAPGRGEAR